MVHATVSTSFIARPEKLATRGLFVLQVDVQNMPQSPSQSDCGDT